MSDAEQEKQAGSRFALFALAFRPFFLGGSFVSVISLAIWVSYWLQPFQWKAYGNPIWWHAHELIFGFAAAIITGFLLTAVQSWTRIKGLNGISLASLFTLWLLARVLLLVPLRGSPSYIAFIDVLFLVAASACMAYPVIKSKQKRNMMFSPILLLFAALNGLSHYGLASGQEALVVKSFHAAIMIIILLVTIISGRVLPFFMANASAYQRQANLPILEFVSIGCVVFMLTVALYGFSNTPEVLLMTISMLGALSHTFRMMRWGTRDSLKKPLLWSLHLSYSFIPIGFFMLFLWTIQVVNNFSAVLHVFTVGSMAGMILAMISRVSLGHSGRPLKAARIMSLAFILVAISALSRSFGVLVLGNYYQIVIITAGVLWILAFTIFIVVYFPILIRPRIDGKDG